MFNDKARQCNATAKSTGEQCKNPAVSGSTKCRLHGGNTPRGEASPHFIHGARSKYRDSLPDAIREKVAVFEENDDPLNLVDELNTQRAIFSQFIARWRQPHIKMTEADIMRFNSLLDAIGRTVERMARIRNQQALTGAEVAYLKTRTIDVVVKYIDNPEKRRAFLHELFEIREPAQLE